MQALAKLNNPVLWQEATHQIRAVRRWAHRMEIIGVLLVLAIIIGVPLTLLDVQSPSRELAILAIWFVHAITATYAIVVSANVISREHSGLTWDALVLTQLSARQILFGKWRAVLFRMRGWMLALGVVRLAMLPVFMISLLNRFAWYGYGYGYGARYGEDFAITWSPLAALVAVLMTVVLTVFEVLCSTAIGLAASAVMRRGTLATVLAMIVRFTPVALFAAFTRYELSGYSMYRWWRFAPMSLADAGTSAMYQLMLPIMPWTRSHSFDTLPGLIMAATMLGALSGAALLIALYAIRSGGALPAEGELLID